jgi:hypothetical protein
MWLCVYSQITTKISKMEHFKTVLFIIASVLLFISESDEVTLFTNQGFHSPIFQDFRKVSLTLGESSSEEDFGNDLSLFDTPNRFPVSRKRISRRIIRFVHLYLTICFSYAYAFENFSVRNTLQIRSCIVLKYAFS